MHVQAVELDSGEALRQVSRQLAEFVDESTAEGRTIMAVAMAGAAIVIGCRRGADEAVAQRFRELLERDQRDLAAIEYPEDAIQLGTQLALEILEDNLGLGELDVLADPGSEEPESE